MIFNISVKMAKHCMFWTLEDAMYIDPCNLTKLLQYCAHSTELNIGAAYGKKDYPLTYIQALVDNLTPQS